MRHLSELQAVEPLWPQVPHQVCQFHALRDASQSAFDADRGLKTAIRKHLQPKVRAVRKQLTKQIPTAPAAEAEQIAVIDDYASGILTALNTDGIQHAQVRGGGSRSSVRRRGSQPAAAGKKGGAVSTFSAQKLARLQTIVAERATWAESVVQVKHMRQCVLDAEPILDSSWTQAGEVLSNAMVGQRLDGWRQQMSEYLTDGQLPELEQECLTQFLQQLTNLRPYLVQCYDRKDFPRTNNDMERSIRGLKTRYRRISGRKNWNSYLLRYGRCVAYYEWWEHDATRRQQLVERASRLNRARWHQMRRETTAAQRGQLTRFRFRHKRETFLASLEDRWAAAAST